VRESAREKASENWFNFHHGIRQSRNTMAACSSSAASSRPVLACSNWQSIFSADRSTRSSKGGSIGVCYLDAEKKERRVELVQVQQQQQQDEEEEEEYTKSKKKKSVALHIDVKQVLGEDKAGQKGTDVGAVVWDAGEFLAQFICGMLSDDDDSSSSSSSSPLNFFQDKCVIDLGSGTGICGLAAAIAGAKQVVLTDMEVLRTLCEANIAALSEASVRHKLTLQTLPTFCTYFWGNANDEIPIRAANESGVYDVVLAGDDLYEDRSVPALLITLQAITDEHSLVIFSYKRRLDRREIPYFEAMSEFMSLYVLKPPEDCQFVETFIILGAKIGGVRDESLKGIYKRIGS
jgi:hypothetical protein